MTIIAAIRQFGGILPRYSPKEIPNTNAQNAMNVRLLSRELRPWKTASSVVTPSKVGTKKSIYRFGQDLTDETQFWFHWLNDTDVARGPVPGDTSERTYFTESGQLPRYTDSSIATSGGGTDYPTNYYTLGVPAPVSTPTVTITGSGTGTAESINVVYTYVCGGQEGPPSPASNIAQWQYGQTINISNMGTGPGGGYNCTAKRIYRVITTDTGSDYRFQEEISAAATTNAPGNTTADADLGNPLGTVYWYPPPTNMMGIIPLWNGMMGGFETNRVWLCEPYAPHAWPYWKSLPYGILGLGAFGQTIVAVTKGDPQVGIGADPASLQFQKIGQFQAGVSKRSIVSMPGGVAYAAADGIAYINSSGAKIATADIFTREEWQTIYPQSIAGYRLGDRYVGFYDTGVTQGGFIFNPDDPLGTFTLIDTFATAGYTDLQREALYLCVGGNIVRWDNGNSTQSYTWKSKRFVVDTPCNAGVLQLEAVSFASSPTVKVYAKDSSNAMVLKATITVTGPEPIKLPSGYKSREFEVQIEGSATIQALYLAEVVEDLKRVPG